MSRRPEKIAISPKEAIIALRKFDSHLSAHKMLEEIKDAFFPKTDLGGGCTSYDLGLWGSLRLHINFLKTLGFTFCMLTDGLIENSIFGLLSEDDLKKQLKDMPECECCHCI